MKLTVNLNGNFLCPFQILIDIHSQLPQASPGFNPLVFSPICELNSINDWINLESLGKPVALRAQMLTHVLKPLFQSCAIDRLELSIYLPEGRLQSDNLYALLFLAETPLTLLFAVKPEYKAHLQQLLSPLSVKNNVNIDYIPQDIWEQDARQIANTTQLEKNRYQILRTVGFPFCNQWCEETVLNKENVPLLIGYAWTCLKSGAHEIGTDVLMRALNKPELPALIREQLFMHLQLTRFLSHQYKAVTEESFPDQFHYLETNDATSINFIKAYSATLCRNLAVAETYFEKCGINEQLPLTDENSLYRLNLYALFLVLRGKADTAFELEIRIKAFIEKNKINTVGLKYVNFINTARLYKKAGQYDNALAYYDLAYQEISGGGYTPSDRIYYHMNLGSVHEAAGRIETALFFWVKAAIYWLSFNNKYALSWRPRLILCQEKITDILNPLAQDKVNQFLYDKIHALINQCSIQVDRSIQTPFQFRAALLNQSFKSEGIEQSNLTESSKACYIAKNLILYGSADPTVTPIGYTQNTEKKLALLLSSLLKHVMKIDSNYHTLLIDTHNEVIYPLSDPGCWIIATLAGCQRCYHNGQPLYYDLTQTSNLLSQIKITLAPTIASIKPGDKGLQLNYKRSFLNKTLCTTAEIDLVKRLEKDSAFNLNQLDSDTQTTLNALIEKKVVVLAYPSTPAPNE